MAIGSRDKDTKRSYSFPARGRMFVGGAGVIYPGYRWVRVRNRVHGRFDSVITRVVSSLSANESHRALVGIRSR